MEKLDTLFKISWIIAREKIGELTDEEKSLLQKWLSENEKNKGIYNSLKESAFSNQEISEFELYNTKQAFKKVRKTLKGQFAAKRILFIPKIYKYAAAIAVICICSYLLYNHQTKQTSLQYSARFIKSGTRKATLTTSNNQKIELGNSKQKTVYIQEDAKIVDTNAVLTYNSTQTSKQELITEKFNQLETPKGGEYTLILSDGTKVMLNSASRIKYPIAFNNNKREVELTGEAYFEVEKMKNKPFIIHIGNASVMVYGTSFNISAYDDDEVLQATLVEGNIGLSILKENKPVEYKLTPGKQAEYNKVTSHVETKEVNTDLYTAWTKDRFMFENESIEKILKRLARWYDLDVQYADERIKNQFFTGELNLKKYDNIVKILEMLAAASDIEFKIEQRKLIVEVRK